MLGRSLGTAALLMGARCGLRTARRSSYAGNRGGGRFHHDFGGITFHGPPAAWLREQQRICRVGYEPTPIQASSMHPILDGKSVAVMSPTGTGKTLAYLLPLWERTVEAVPAGRPGPCFLIIAPSQDLQLQVGTVLRFLAGKTADTSVLVLRRSLDNLAERIPAARAIVATPSLLMEQFDMEQLGAVWKEAASAIQAIVVDEADCMVPPGGARDSTLGRVLAFIMSARQAGLGAAHRPPQLVLASASIDAYTLSLLEDAVGVQVLPVRGEPDSFAEQGAVLLPEAASESDGERDWLWPNGLQHMLLPIDHLNDRQGKISKRALTPIAQVIHTLSPQRCLVVFAEKKATAERGASLGKYLSTLRQKLRPQGYHVATVSAAVEAAGGLEGGRLPDRQVLVGRSEAIRGLDLAGVDVVVLVGELNTSREYMHIVGRTARWEAGRGAPEGGTVVSIVNRLMARTFKRWSRELGFRFEGHGRCLRRGEEG